MRPGAVALGTARTKTNTGWFASIRVSVGPAID
jgi:hypothetical protein